MRIAQIASNVERVPPPGYGGTEVIVNLITEELVRRGHQVTLFATGDSQTNARLVSVVELPLRTHKSYLIRQWPAFEIRTMLELYNMRDEFDIVHNHLGYQAFPHFEKIGLPNITTNHNPIKPYNAPVYLAYKHLPFVAISETYKKLNYPSELNYVGTIYNSIDTDAFEGNGKGNRSYLLFLGRLSKDKGTYEAIQIAKNLSLPLKIAGKIDDADRAYFQEFIEPNLANGSAEYLGEVGHTAKVDLYKNAIAVVYPIAFEEPFGLVMAEAQACGTPVLALDRGSVREVLSDKETGIIGKSVDELVSRFKEIENIKPEACRKRVVDLFNSKRMVDQYESLYKKILKNNR
jgi:glycosyltransferase involved in cell wall biosynthesis